MEVKDTCANHRACRNTPWFHATLQYFSYTCVRLCLTVSLLVSSTKHSINFAMPTETSVVIHWHADVLDSSPDMLTVVKKHLKTKQVLIRVHCIQVLIVPYVMVGDLHLSFINLEQGGLSEILPEVMIFLGNIVTEGNISPNPPSYK